MHAIRKYLGLLVVAPLLIVATLLALLTQGLHQYPLAVSQEDVGFDLPGAGHVNVPETLVATLDKSVFAITTVKTKAEAQALLDAGIVKAALTFPAALSEDMFIKQDDPTYVLPAKIQLQVAGDNPLAKLLVVAALAKSFGPAMAESGGLSLDSLPIPIDVAAFAEGLSGAGTYTLASSLGFLAAVLTGIFSMLATRSRAKAGPPDRKKAPATALAHLVAFTLAGWLLYLGLTATAYALLGMPFDAGWLAGSAMLMVLLFTTAGVGQAIAANEPQRAFAVIPYLILPLFLGGLLFPIELLPNWLQWLEFLFPAHYGVPLVGAVQLGHYPPTFGLDLGILIVFALVVTGASIHGLTNPPQEKNV